MDINSIINLVTTNEKVLFTLAALALTITLTQLIKVIDRTNKLADWYGIIGIVMGGIIGYIGGHWLIPSIGDLGALYGIVATYIYSHLPAGFLAKMGLANNADLPENAGITAGTGSGTLKPPSKMD